MEKHFYTVHYWYEQAPRSCDTHVFYGTLEDMEYMIHRMMEVSPYKIQFADADGLDFKYHSLFEFPNDLKWRMEK